MDAAMEAPFSQCDAKGRCIRHPTIQMSRRKKLGGGWKKLLAICPMCAMEMIVDKDESSSRSGSANPNHGSNVRSALAVSRSVGRSHGGRIGRGVDPDSVSLHSGSSSNSSGGKRREMRRPRVGHHDADEMSVNDQTVRSAPSTYGYHPREEHHHSRRNHRDAAPRHNHHPRNGRASSSRSSHSSSSRGSSQRSSAEFGFHKRASDTSDSSCDTTVDMSYSSHDSQASSRSGRSSSSSSGRRSPRSSANRPRHHNDGAGDHQEEEEFVCGMELYVGEHNRCYYTGQIHVGSQLPHGLGTLRSDVDGTMMEGEWRFGRLVRDSRAAAAPPQDYEVHGGEQCMPVSPLEYPEEGEEGDGMYHQEEEEEYHEEEDCADYCLPCTSRGEGQQHPQQQGGAQHTMDPSLCDSFQQSCHVIGTSSEESSISNSIAETIHDDDDDDDDGSQSTAAWSRDSSYSARESKSSSSLSSPPKNNRATTNKLHEFEQYIERCDEDGDYYYPNNNEDSFSSVSFTSPAQLVNNSGEEYDARPRRVRFREDP